MVTVNVALIGYAFMGRAHSNAYRQVTPFFSPRLTPRLKVICGRTRTHVDAAARTLGWEESATDWEAVVARPDIDLVDISTPGDSHAAGPEGRPNRDLLPPGDGRADLQARDVRTRGRQQNEHQREDHRQLISPTGAQPLVERLDDGAAAGIRLRILASGERDDREQ